MPQDREILKDFTLLGGPLHRLGCRLGLVDSENTVKLGLVLGLLAWTILLVLSLIEGVSGQVLSFSVIGGHIRLLLVIPLFFICESLVDPRMTVFIQTIVRSRVVPHNALPALDYEIARISRWKDAWLPELIFILAAVLLTLMAPQMQLPGTSSSQDVGVTMTSLWYWIFCLALFRFLILRWLWSLGLWYFLLWRISRQDLHLVPTHPDGVGGLGYLAVVQAHFTPFVLAISLLTAAMFAEEFSAGLTSFESISEALKFGVPSVALKLDWKLYCGCVLFVSES
jgi:ABC-type amino acid transport system permease subunit